MTGKRAYIWDLDGTLINSYDIIVKSIDETFREFGIEMSREDIHRHCIKYSVSSLFIKVGAEHGLTYEQIRGRYGEISGDRKLDIKLMPGGKEILQALCEDGCENYVYTHRGASTMAVLENLEIKEFFGDIVTSLNGFERKPHPQGIDYLVEKYGLDKARTYYVGDRSIDMECAANAGVAGILYLPDDSIGQASGAETYIVDDLMKIRTIC